MANETIADIRRRYFDAIKQGYSPVDATRIAHGQDPVESQTGQTVVPGPRVPGPADSKETEPSPEGNAGLDTTQSDAFDPASVNRDADREHEFDLDTEQRQAAGLRDDIPDDWRTFAWPKLRTLAAQFSNGAQITSKVMAFETIETELARRAQSQ